jgi:predicted enzyme related to lactoylglutathione lyase
MGHLVTLRRESHHMRICGYSHARGVNADLPPQWLIYFTVADIHQCIVRCVDQGGEVLAPPCDLGSGVMCVIRDPAGAVCALYTPAGSS